MNYIRELAIQFRKAIDSAQENDEFRRPPFSHFPNDCCDFACDLLGAYLSEHNISTYQINGVCKFDHTWHHVWLVTHNNIVIDITEDQFIGKFAFVQNALKVHVGQEDQIQKIFSQNRVRECNTNFTNPNAYTDFDKQPNPRQKALINFYEIINQYL